MMRRGRRWIVALVLVLGASVVVQPSDRFEQVTVDATAGGVKLTAALINPSGRTQATDASCRLETAEIRFTYDGTTVTSSVGTLLETGEILAISGNDRLNQFRAIRTGASSGQLDCTYTP